MQVVNCSRYYDPAKILYKQARSFPVVHILTDPLIFQTTEKVCVSALFCMTISPNLFMRGDQAARKAVYANRMRLRSDIGRETVRRRGELVERSFAHILDRRGMRRAWLRGRENLHKRYLIHVAGFNLRVLMRALYGQGTPREAAEAVYGLTFVLQSDAALVFALIATVDGELAGIVFVATDPTRN
jgi:hypothetical protein